MKMSKLIKKELGVVVNLENDELKEFKDLTKKTLEEIEKTKKEMKVEERIQLNLGFVHFKLQGIHENICNLIEIAKNTSISEEDLEFEINHRVKSIIKDIVELESIFLPTIRESIAKLEKGETQNLVEQMKSDLVRYEDLIMNLKKVFKLTSYSVEEIKAFHKNHLGSMKAKINK